MPTQVIDKKRVQAMFYNNKGVDALINDDLTLAYAYFRKALTTDAQFGEGWANLGLIYRWADKLDYAEATYQQALLINQNDPTTWENLAYLYTLTDRQPQADSIVLRLKNKRMNNPNYHFMLGEVQYNQKNFTAAVKHYRKAIKLNDQQHEFYFSLAKSYYQLGQMGNSRKYMRLARKHSKGDEGGSRYQSKLDRLSKL
ncbi:MAG: Flp pilus assembly protein TadD [Alteromonadaceae bacterium]|jgi:Flp pilus assembly protein TadD